VRLLRSRLNSLRPPPLQDNLPAYGDLPIGPYNHRMTLEGALRRIEALDAGWVRDFLRIYTEGLTSVVNFNLDTSPPAAPVKAMVPKRKIGSPIKKSDPGSNALSLALGD
jgi:hypothetical protein